METGPTGWVWSRAAFHSRHQRGRGMETGPTGRVWSRAAFHSRHQERPVWKPALLTALPLILKGI